MGFDNECILDIQSLAGEYFCPVCRLLVYPNEAIQSQCTHLYCKPCLTYVVSTTRACPYDGYLVTEADSKPLLESNKALADTIGQIAVHCLYHRSGCTWQGPLSECTSHCSGCSFGNSPVVCNRCGIQIVHRQVQEHAQSCPGVQPQTQQIEGAQSTAASGSAVADQNQNVTQAALAATSQVQTNQPSILVAGSDANLQAQVVTQAGVPTAEQWYQQQQQYQQYYQQYHGYDPYQQQYQQYYPYQQYPVQQYPQQPPVTQTQSQPSLVPVQNQPQIYSNTQTQLPPQFQPQGPHLPSVAVQNQNQMQVNPIPQISQNSLPPPPPQLQPGQAYPPPHPYATQALHPSQNPHASHYQQPHSQMMFPQPPHSQAQLHPLPPHSQAPQLQIQHHPHQALSQPTQRPNTNTQPHPPHVPTVLGYNSYPVPYQQISEGVQQQPTIHMHVPNVLPQQPQYQPQMQSQFPQQPQQTRPPQSHIPNAHVYPLTQQSPNLAPQRPVMHQHMSQFPQQQVFPGQASSLASTHLHQQVPFVQKPLQSTHSPLRPLVQHQSFQQLPGPPQQALNHIGRPVVPNQGMLSQPFPHPHGLTSAAQVRSTYPSSSQHSANQNYPLRTDGQLQSSHSKSGLNLQPTVLEKQEIVNNEIKEGKKDGTGDDSIEKKSLKSEHDIKSENDIQKHFNTDIQADTSVNHASVPTHSHCIESVCVAEDGSHVGPKQADNSFIVDKEIQEAHLMKSPQQNAKLRNDLDAGRLMEPLSTNGNDGSQVVSLAPLSTSNGQISRSEQGNCQSQVEGNGFVHPSHPVPLSDHVGQIPSMHYGPHQDHLLGYPSGLPRPNSYYNQVPMIRGPHPGHLSNIGHPQPINPIDGSKLDSRFLPFENGPYGQPISVESNMETMDVAFRNERFKFPHNEHMNPYSMESGRRGIDREFEDHRHLPRPPYSDLEHDLRTSNYISSSRPFDGPLDKGPHRFNYDGFGPDAIGPPRFMPPFHPNVERTRPIGFHDDIGGRVDHGHPGFFGRDYSGGQSNLDDIGARDSRLFGEGSKSSATLGNRFHESRYPDFSSRPPHRADFDGPGNLRMVGDFAPGAPHRHFKNNEFLDQDMLPSHLRKGGHFGPHNLPGRLRLGEPKGFGSYPGHDPVGDVAAPGNFPAHRPFGEPFGGKRQPRLGEPGFRSSYSHHEYSNDDSFYTGNVESLDYSRKRKLTTMGWCRICKFDCETVEGLELHSQTKEHQKMAMDMVLSIKQQNPKKHKVVSNDQTPIEEVNQSGNVSLKDVKIPPTEP